MADHNLEIWERLHSTPPEYTKPIAGGDLKNMTATNPTFVWKQLTELFGPEGVDWWVDELDRESEHDPVSGEVTYHVRVQLTYRRKSPITGNIEMARVSRWGQCSAAYQANRSGSSGGYRKVDPYARQKAHTNAVKGCAAALGSTADIRLGENYIPDEHAEDRASGNAAPAAPTVKDPRPELLGIMVERCSQLGIDDKELAKGAVRSCIRSLGIDVTSVPAMNERFNDIVQAIGAWTPPPSGDSKF